MLSHFVCPATLFDALLDEVERIPDRHDIAMIGWRRSIGVRIQGQKSLVLLPRVARRMVVLSLLCARLLLRMSSKTCECCCGQRYGTQSKKAAACGVFQLEYLVSLVAHHLTS